MTNEKRLIDANALFPGKILAVNIKNPMETVEDLMNRINNAPTVDAVEVVHGRWIIDRERLIATCSECEHILRFSDEMQIVLLADNERFCYYCGAKMDGDGNG